MVSAVIFDLDGVIADTEPLWDRQMDIFLERRGIPHDRAATKHLLIGKTLPEGVKILQEKYGFTGDVEAQAAERREIIHGLFMKDVHFVPGFREFFATLGSIKKAVGTSLERYLMDALDQKLHFSELFAGHVYSISDIGNVSKPNPDIFLHAARQIGALPEECAVIEDSPNGVEAARRAGMKCVGLATTFGEEKLQGATIIVESYGEINLKSLEA